MLITRREKLTGPNSQTARELDTILSRLNAAEMDESSLIALLSTLSQGRRAQFNPRTHKQETQEFQRFNYFYLAAQIMAGRNPEEVQDDIMTHLELATATLLAGWGQAEYAHLSQNASQLSDFGPAAEKLALPLDTQVSALTGEQRSQLIAGLGALRTAEIHRNVLLSVITELWVEYLTRVEALRVSIGLEAYGQRDPLVQYKTKASDMFQVLMGEVRSGVIDRVFRYLPRMVSTQAFAEPTGDAEPAAPQPQLPSQSASHPSEADARSGRKRHKKK
jgi:preprotein translocase subunit SecA